MTRHRKWLCLALIAAAGCTSDGSDFAPSNGLAKYLDMATTAADLDLGSNTATIDTTDGTVMVDGKPVTVKNVEVAQTNGPLIRVFIVHSLTARPKATSIDDMTNGVGIVGSDAFALVSEGDIDISGTLVTSVTDGDIEFGLDKNSNLGVDPACHAHNNDQGGGDGGAGFGDVARARVQSAIPS